MPPEGSPKVPVLGHRGSRRARAGGRNRHGWLEQLPGDHDGTAGKTGSITARTPDEALMKEGKGNHSAAA